MVIGDSQARDVINMASEGAGLDAGRIAYQVADSCSDAAIRNSLGRTAEADTIILASGVDRTQLSCFENWIAQLKTAGAGHVVVLGHKQCGWSINPLMLQRPEQRLGACIRPTRYEIAENRIVGNTLLNDNFIGPMALITDSAGWVPVFTPQGRLITQD